MKKILIISLAAITLLSTGCSKKHTQSQLPAEESIEITLQPTDTKIPEIPQTWHITNKRICVIFGYDFNTPEIYEPLKAQLSQKFGLNEDGGLIYPLVYPEDFKHAPKGYSSDLYSILNDDENDFAGLIILGAPEKTHLALARLQDKWEQTVPYPIIALYPQDDVLGMEAACDVVIDQGQNSDGNLEESEQVISDADEVLIETINYLIALGVPMTRDTSVQTHVQQMYKNKNIRRYVDSESGLQSINHFVFK